MRDTPWMNHTLDRSLILSGNALDMGSLRWTRPYFPTRDERAGLVGSFLPSWAVASAHTSGWVWTGMGSPEPWSVLRAESPALSPLERQHWHAGVISHHHTVRTMGALHLLDPCSTMMEILLRCENIDSAAAQIFALQTGLDTPLHTLPHRRRASPASRTRALRIIERVSELQELYPDITRYTS